MRERMVGSAAGCLVVGLLLAVPGGTAVAQEEAGEAEPAPSSAPPSPPEGQKLPPLPEGEDLGPGPIRFIPPKWYVGQKWLQIHVARKELEDDTGPGVALTYQRLEIEALRLVRGWPHDIGWKAETWMKVEDGEWSKVPTKRSGKITFVPGGHRVLEGDETTGREVAELLGPPFFLEMRDIPKPREVGDTWTKDLGRDAVTGETVLKAKLASVKKADGIRLAQIEFEIECRNADIGIRGTCWWNLDDGIPAAMETERWMHHAGRKDDERRSVRTRELAE